MAERARNDKGQLKADDPSTPDVNEAWVGGTAPSKSAKNVFRTAEEELTKTFLIGALQYLDQL